MAIIKTIVSDRGVVYPDQYCRINEVQTTKDEMTYTVGVYFNQEATENPPHRAEQFTAPFDLYGEQNIWQQAYANLKTIWTDAADA